jgi:hypothetical protein
MEIPAMDAGKLMFASKHRRDTAIPEGGYAAEANFKDKSSHKYQALCSRNY